MRTLEQQIATLDDIRASVLAAPETFNMAHWHSECNTTHCMAGFAALNNSEPLTSLGLTAEAPAAEVGGALLPEFREMFYGTSEHILIWLRCRAYTLRKGQVVKDSTSGFWVDLGCNFYDGSLSEVEASAQSTTNIGCTGCTGWVR